MSPFVNWIDSALNTPGPAGSSRKTMKDQCKILCDKPLLVMTEPPAKHEALFFVYVLGSRRENDRRTYVGWTTDLDRRLEQHNTGVGAKSTRGHKWILLYSEPCKTRQEAMSREWYIKRDRKLRRTLRARI
jgi:putative endonuclease